MEYDQKNPEHWPKTVEAAVDLLMVWLHPDAVKQFEKATRKQVYEEGHFHFSYGQFVRNSMGLWSGNFDLIKACSRNNPDDASAVIIKQLWERIQKNKSSD